MILKVFAVFDSAANVFGNPWVMLTKAEAMRGFEVAANDPESKINAHPADFTLFYLGEFDNVEGAYKLEQVPESLGNAVGHKAQMDLVVNNEEQG